jgi:exonuclease SbcC
VTKEQEEAADAAAEEAVRVAEGVGAEVAAVRARADELTARLAAVSAVVNVPSATAGGSEWHIHPAELDRLARVAEEQAARLGAVAAELPALQREADVLARGIAAAQTRAAELTQQHEAALDQAAGAQRRADEHRGRLREQLGDARDLAAALTAARADAHALIAAADAAEAAARASEAAAQAHAMAAQAAADAGFAGIDDARTAYRDTAWREEATATISGHETETASVTALLAENEVALEPPAGVASAGHAADAARAEYDQAVASHARAQRKHEQLCRLLPELDRALADFEPVREYAAEVRRLADLAAGQGANVLRMTLSSFVLAARLEEVAAAASQRLLRMTAGRYSLVHTDMRRGGGRSGLRLLARDAWTGHDRDTSTLSGGETFMASLALALGLADVVTEEAGGGRIEALFVDEGFGSLDEETLEEVMNVLDSLREGGRLVGIVSHVAELRQRIPAQIKVRKTHTGSHLAVAS